METEVGKYKRLVKLWTMGTRRIMKLKRSLGKEIQWMSTMNFEERKEKGKGERRKGKRREEREKGKKEKEKLKVSSIYWFHVYMSLSIIIINLTSWAVSSVGEVRLGSII